MPITTQCDVMDPRKLHASSRIIIILIIGAMIYLLSYLILSQFMLPAQGGHMAMMTSFYSPEGIILQIISVSLALAGMLGTSLYLFGKPEDHEKDDFHILKRALTGDEQKLLGEVRKEPEGITQDSLRFRLDWSKAKVSTMLTNLDRMGLVQRERFGKTFKVHYNEKN
jgi:uncharacterized membrane protein